MRNLLIAATMVVASFAAPVGAQAAIPDRDLAVSTLRHTARTSTAAATSRPCCHHKPPMTGIACPSFITPGRLITISAKPQ